MKNRGIGYTISFTFGITFLIVFLLSATHTVTAPLAELHEIERRKGTVLDALGLPTESRSAIFEQYAALETLLIEGRQFYVHPDGTALATHFYGPGVWGEISGVVALSDKGERVVGVAVLDHSETPGLGGRITERRFLDQFRGERLGPAGLGLRLRGARDTERENGRVDGIAGATSTSRAFHAMVNRQLLEMRELLAGVGHER